MAYHVTICIIHNDKIVFILVDGSHQFIFYFIGTHLRFQVVSGNFRRRNQDTVLVIVRSFATAVKEECYVSIFLCFGNVKLFHSFSSQVFSKCVSNIFLVEENVYTFERSVVRSHTVILQPGNSVHTRLRHILLRQNDCQFLSTVITVIEENNDIAFLNGTVYIGIHNRFDELIRYTFIVRLLHSLHHVSSFLTDTVYQQVVCLFHTFPTFITVHGIVTSDNRSYFTGRLGTVCFQLFDKAFTAFRVCVTSVHKAMNESILNIIFFSNITKFEQVIQRTVHTAI